MFSFCPYFYPYAMAYSVAMYILIAFVVHVHTHTINVFLFRSISAYFQETGLSCWFLSRLRMWIAIEMERTQQFQEKDTNTHTAAQLHTFLCSDMRANEFIRSQKNEREMLSVVWNIGRCCNKNVPYRTISICILFSGQQIFSSLFIAVNWINKSEGNEQITFPLI